MRADASINDELRSIKAAEIRSGAILTIDLDAVRQNWLLLAAMAGTAICAAVVKANAYGLGAERVAPVLAKAGCRHFFVAHVEEAIQLRGILGQDPMIAVLHGAPPGSERDCCNYNLVPVLNEERQLIAWRELARSIGERLPAILQVDTGMARYGYEPCEFLRLMDQPSALDGLSVLLVMSHLACADDRNHPENVEQLRRFSYLSRRLQGVPASLSASSGMFLGSEYHFEMVRPGAALFGIAPQSNVPNPMKPVVRLQGRVVQVRSVPAGTSVGYGQACTVTRESRLATVSVGYADGIFRSAAGKCCVWLEEIPLPVLGRISMDSIIVDVSQVPPQTLERSSFVDIIGGNGDVDAFARAAGTIGYEVLTNLGNRFHRHYEGN